MPAVKSIIVPVDYTEVSAGACRYALQMAERLGAAVNLLYAVPAVAGAGESGVFTVTLHEQIEQSARTDMEEFMRTRVEPVLATMVRPPRVTANVTTGDLRHEIRRFAKHSKSELIVMGTKGAQDNWDEFFGTNASFLIAKSPCPVIIVPEGTGYRPLEAVCYATDLNHTDAFRAGHVLKLLTLNQPEIHFVHITGQKAVKPSFPMELLQDIFNRPGYSVTATFTEVEAEDAVAGIFKYARERKCDLVVMHRPEEKWWNRVFRKSTTREAALKATVPLLVFGEDSLAEFDGYA